MTRGRHRRPTARHPWRIILPLIAIILTAGLWTLPEQAVILPKTQSTCIITGGGTIRVHTSDCGTLWYRGHAPLLAGYRYTVTRTGPLAWRFQQQ